PICWTSSGSTRRRWSSRKSMAASPPSASWRTGRIWGWCWGRVRSARCGFPAFSEPCPRRNDGSAHARHFCAREGAGAPSGWHGRFFACPMKLALLSESPADEAAIEILVEAVLQEPVERVRPSLRARGWPNVLQLLPAVVRHLHFNTNVELLV